MYFATEHPFVQRTSSDGDVQLSCIIFGWTLGFCYFVICHARRETKRARKINLYVILIWTEIVASMAYAAIGWLYLKGVIRPSFPYYLSVTTVWVIQIQVLLQVIVNRISILLPNERRRNYLRFGVAGAVLAINISVYCIWVPAQLQISERYIALNRWWDRCEKCIYLVIDGALNFYFIHAVKQRLVSRGLKKYDALVRYNIQIIVVSLALDVMIIGTMSLNNPFVYNQFHPVAYLAKLNIEMSMSSLIIKVASQTGVTMFEDVGASSSRRDEATTKTGANNMEVFVNRQVYTTHEPGDIDIQLDRRWSGKKAGVLPPSDVDEGSIDDTKTPVV